MESERSRGMRSALVGLFFLFGAFTAVSQNDSIDKAKSSKIKLNEFKTAHHKNEAAHFLNFRLVSSRIVEGINPKDIEGVYVRKGDTVVFGKKFSGKIFISLKKEKEYEFVSLKDIKNKHTSIKQDNVLYMLNGKFIEDNEEKYTVEKNYFLRAYSLSDFNPYLKEKGVQIINILTKTPQNLSPKIIIRGNEVSETE